MIGMKFTGLHRQDARYLVAYIAPLAAAAGFQAGGIWSPGAMYVAFVLIPLIELFSGGSTANLPASEELPRSKRLFFDFLLYLNLPILYGLLWLFGNRLYSGGLSTGEWVGMVLNMGLIVGVSGINVGHELGHRARRYERVMAWLLLLPALYMHFYIEHNRGHHRWVATPKDPATARRSEWIYTFWWRSMRGGWINAWRLEAERLSRDKLPVWHYRNQMLVFQGAQALYLAGWYMLAGWNGLAGAVLAALVGVLLLESINYVEHYGLQRATLPGGRYERVLPRHSWNSDHHLGRIFLYELTRHSDHHYLASRKYQILRHFDESPQLPLGYPGSILLALVPPLWFRVMNREVDRWNAGGAGVEIPAAA
jgi:alkane 1-monooxygenase